MAQIIKSRHPPVKDGPKKGDNLATFLESNPNRVPETKPAYIRAQDGKALNRKEFFKISHQIAWSLVHKLKLKPNSRVAVFSPNNIQYPTIIHADLLAGVTTVTLNPAYSVDELIHPLTDCKPEYIFTAPALVSTMKDAVKRAGLPLKHSASRENTIWVLDDADQYQNRKEEEQDMRTLADAAQGQKLQAVPIDDPTQTDAFICYSSGTSGKPKGVQLPHSNFFWLCKMMKDGRHGDVTVDDVALAVLPFSHIFALFHVLVFDLYFGITAVVMPKFELEPFLQNIQRYSITGIEIVPPMLVLLAKHPIVDKYDLSTLRFMISGAAPLSAELGDQVEARLNKGGKANVRLCQGYGLSETSPSSHAVSFREYNSKGYKGSTGELFPNLEARLVDEDGKDVGHEQGGETPRPGELWLRGPTIMKGYLNRPDATAECIDSEGWFQTGDVAIVNKSGQFFIVDRKKELIKYKGFQVAPAEMEALLLDHKDVADAAVIGIYDESEATELPVAFIVASEHYKGSSEQLCKDVRSWIDGKVAHYKKLRGGVRIKDVIPKSPSGKILRRILRDELAEEAKSRRGTSLMAKL